MGNIALLSVNKKHTKKFEKSKMYETMSQNEVIYKVLEKKSNKAYLINNNNIFNIEEIGIPDEFYYYLEVDNKNNFSGLTIRGTWEEAVFWFEMNVVGAMTFIIKDRTSDDTHYDYLKSFFSLDIVKNHLRPLSRFYSTISKHPVDCEFFEEIDENSLDEDNDTRCFYEIMREQSREDLTDDLIKDINDQYVLDVLALSLSEDIEDEKTLIYSLAPDDTRTYTEREDYIFNDLFNDLECIKDDEGIEFAYSTWKETRNIELYADLGLDDDGNYVSFPTLYVGEYQGDPESGSWESNS